MLQLLRNFVLWFAVMACAAAALAADGDTVVQRVRSELAEILKKDPAKLTIEKPITEFGADELDVVEWVMAVEEAFRVSIPDEKVFDPKSKAARKDLSIASMASIVLELKNGNGKKK